MTAVKLTRVYKGMQATKYGDKPKVAIKCEQFGDKWLSTFKVTPKMDTWKEGDTVEINITEKNGYLNFEAGFEIPADNLSNNVVLPTMPSIQLDTQDESKEFEF